MARFRVERKQGKWEFSWGGDSSRALHPAALYWETHGTEEYRGHREPQYLQTSVAGLLETNLLHGCRGKKRKQLGLVFDRCRPAP